MRRLDGQGAWGNANQRFEIWEIRLEDRKMHDRKIDLINSAQRFIFLSCIFLSFALGAAERMVPTTGTKAERPSGECSGWICFGLFGSPRFGLRIGPGVWRWHGRPAGFGLTRVGQAIDGNCSAALLRPLRPASNGTMWSTTCPGQAPAAAPGGDGWECYL